MSYTLKPADGLRDLGSGTSVDITDSPLNASELNCKVASTNDYDDIVTTFGIVIGITDICLGTTGNLLTIIAILGNKKLQNKFHTFIVCLCFVDLLTAAVMMPFNVASYILQTWPFGKTSITCSIQAYSYYCCGYTSIVCLLVLTVNRYIGIVQPRRYASLFSRARVWITIVISWVFAPAVMAPFFFFTDENGRPGFGWIDEYSLCVFRTQNIGNPLLRPYMIFTRILFQAVPLLVMITLYAIIFNTVRKCGRDVMRMSIRSARSSDGRPAVELTSIMDRSNEKHENVAVGSKREKGRVTKSENYATNPPRAPSIKSVSSWKSGGLGTIVRRRRLMDRRLLSISVTICAAFMILFLPSVIINLLPCSKHLNPGIHKCASIITWLNSCVNPVIYCFMDPKLRKQYRHILHQAGSSLNSFRPWKQGNSHWNVSLNTSSLRTSRIV